MIHCATWLTFECYLKLQYNIEDNLAQTREQTLVPDLFVLTVVFLALKKFGFSEIRNSSPLIFYFFNLFSMQFFSADATMFSIFFFFDHKKLKKSPQKVAHNRPRPFFFSAAPTAQNCPELHFRFIDSFIKPSHLGSLITTNCKNCS